jgi:carboxypeptidase T
MSWLAHNVYPSVLAALARLRAGGRAFCWTFELARTHERRTIAGLRIHGSRRPEGESRGVLIIGAAHAREMAPPEAVLRFADLVCRSYVSGADISFGGKTYAGETVKLLVNTLDIYLVPLLNPDGRAWVESNDDMWRKNRRPAPTPSPPSSYCHGVDLNRNHDFLFSSGLGTSASPCDFQVYRGPAAYSEPETRGIRDLLNQKPHIRGVLDVHSYDGSILYPWGDDENQSTDPTKNFRNSAWDGQRGTLGDEYREFIPGRDLNAYESAAARMVDGVREVAGRRYTAKQGFFLRPWGYRTSGTLKDYPYSRHFVSNALTKAMSMTVEIGFGTDGGFRPAPDSVAQIIRNEGAVLVFEFCLAIMCIGDAVLHATAVRTEAEELRAFREDLNKTPAGARYLEHLEALGGELVPRLVDPGIASETTKLLKVALAWRRGDYELDGDAVRRARRLLAQLRKGASPRLKAALDAAREDLPRIEGKSVKEALKLLHAPDASQERQKPRKKRRPTDS